MNEFLHDWIDGNILVNVYHTARVPLPLFAFQEGFENVAG